MRLFFLFLALPLAFAGDGLAASPSPGTPERALYTVTAQDAEKMIGEALIASGTGKRLEVTLVGDRSQPLNRAAAPISTSVHNLSVDSAARRWSATLTFQAEGTNLTPARVQGRYEEITQVPVFAKMVDHNGIIEASDIETLAIPMHRLHKDTILDAKDLVGKTPNRTIGAGRPVRQNEIAEPAAVKKGAQVTLTYKTGAMLINTLGEVLEAAAVGNRVRVRNVDSNAVVSGTLESDHIVTVSAYR